jgi:hypothetical protein
VRQGRGGGRVGQGGRGTGVGGRVGTDEQERDWERTKRSDVTGELEVKGEGQEVRVGGPGKVRVEGKRANEGEICLC